MNTPDKSSNFLLFHRLAAMSYDSLLLIAVLFIATAIATVLTGGESISAGNPLFTSYLFIVSFAFFAWFWTHGGQTLGMRSWKIRLQRFDGNSITLWQSLLRFITGLPAWIFILLGIVKIVLPEVPDIGPPMSWLFTLPKGVILVIGLVWLVIDNQFFLWRDKFTESNIVQVDK
ncbi:MAG: RDD family protein [Thiohalomonadales bacterium]